MGRAGIDRDAGRAPTVAIRALRDRPAVGLHRRRTASVGLFVTATVLGWAAYRLVEDHTQRPWPALAAWAGSIVCLLFGAWLLERSLPYRLRVGERWSAWEVGGVTALTVVAVVVRAIAVDAVPAHFGGDEGEMGEQARSVREGSLDDPFTTGWLGHPTLWFFGQALALRVLGDDVVGLRTFSALVGALTVPALYWLARTVSGRTVAVVAAALLVGYHFHVHFSRLGLNNISDPLLVVTAYAAFLSGYRSRSLLMLTLSGVALGLAQHAYPGARLAPLVAVAVLLHQLVLDRRRLVAATPGLALGVAGFVLAYGPLLRVPLFHWPDFTSRLAVQGIFQSGWYSDRLAEGASGAAILWDQVWRSLGAPVGVDLRGFYEPGTPLLEPVSAALFLVGVAVLLRNWRRPESALFGAWLLGVVVLGSAMFLDPPQSHHFVSVAPLLCLLVASGLDTVGRLLGRLVPVTRRAVPALTVVAAVGVACWNLAFYFLEYSPRKSYDPWTATAVAEYLAPRRDSLYVYFFGAPFMYLEHGTIRFVARPLGTDVVEPLAALPTLPQPPAGRAPVFVFLPARLGELASVRRIYPEGVVRTFAESPDGSERFYAYEPTRRQ